MLVDPFGRKINYLRISITDRCNYRCVYCLPEGGAPLKPYAEILRYEEIEQIARVAVGLGITRIRLTGGEPLVRKNITWLVERLAAIPGLAELSMTSNGSLLTPELARGLKGAGLDRINISLDTLDQDRFAGLTRGGNIDEVLGGIAAAKAAGLEPVKINMVLMDATTVKEIETMELFCRQQGLRLQTIKHFVLADHKDPQGAISADRPPKCLSCNRLRLTADGYLKPCLFSSHEIRMDLGNIKESVMTAVRAKPENGLMCENRSMRQIGG
ncbi:MAG: radical SAM protein [Desulfobacterales bacterium]|nr:radical SAM protein [Desulfobacterales bacterium]